MSNDIKIVSEKKYMLLGQASEKGSLMITEEVIANIAGLAAMEVEGVNLVKNKLSRVGVGSVSGDAKVTIQDQKVKVLLNLSVDYGYSIPITSAQVQEKVKFMIENMTGLTVSEVSVRVADIRMK